MKKDKTELEVKIQNTLKLSNREDNQIKSLKHIARTNVKLQSAYFSKMAEFSKVNPVIPIVFKTKFKITKTQETDQRSGFRNDHYIATPHNRSQFFYSHSDGYKLRLSAEVICHCSNCTIERKVTAIYRHQPIDAYGIANLYVEPSYYPISFAVNLYILKGEHDSQLKWPFKEEVTITMYHEDDYNTSADRMMDGKNPEYIPHAVAIFEGHRNHTHTESKLDIITVTEKKETDLQLLQLQSQSYHAQMLQNKIQCTLIDKGLLIPLDLQYCKASHLPIGCNVYNETIYFEVTFS